MMEVHKDCFILNGSRFAAMLSAAKVSFVKTWFCVQVSPREELNQT